MNVNLISMVVIVFIATTLTILAVQLDMSAGIMAACGGGAESVHDVPWRGNLISVDNCTLWKESVWSI